MINKYPKTAFSKQRFKIFNSSLLNSKIPLQNCFLIMPKRPIWRNWRGKYRNKRKKYNKLSMIWTLIVLIRISGIEYMKMRFLECWTISLKLGFLLWRKEKLKRLIRIGMYNRIWIVNISIWEEKSICLRKVKKELLDCLKIR